MDTITYLHDRLIVWIAEVEDERRQLAMSIDPDEAADAIAELSHMVRQAADRLHSVASHTMTAADEVRVGAYKRDTPAPVPSARPLRLVHREELLAEVRNGEHDEVVS